MHDTAQAVTVEELVLAVAKVQHDLGAPRLDIDGLDGELALAARLPAHAFRHGPAGAARGDGDVVGDDEARVEPDAELSDELRVLRAVAGQGFEELTGAGTGDGSELAGDLLAGHADSVVPNRDRTDIGVKRYADLEITVTFIQPVVGQRLEPELVRRVGRIGDQLPKKDFLVAVERMDHQIQQLSDLGLESVGLFRLGLFRLCLIHHAISFIRRSPSCRWADMGPAGAASKSRRLEPRALDTLGADTG